MFQAGGELLLMEATTRKRESMVRPLASVRHYYNPYASVDHDLRVFVYAGLMQSLAERRARRKRLAEAASPPAGSS